MAAEFAVAQLFDTDADVLDRRHQVQPVHPAHERGERVGHDRLGLVGFARALAQRLGHHRAEVVDVVQVDVLHRVEPLVEVARHAHVDEEHRTVAAFAQDGLEIVGLEHRARGCERADHDVGNFQVGTMVFEGDGGAAERARERDRMVEGAAGHQQGLGAERMELARGQLGHLARAHEHHRLVAERVENLSPADVEEVQRNIAAVAVPLSDPVEGVGGPLVRLWDRWGDWGLSPVIRWLLLSG